MFCDTCSISLLVGLLTIFVLGYLYIKKLFSYWKNRNILYIKPSFPLGNFQEMNKKHMSIIVKEIYDKFVGKDVLVGMYFSLSPLLIVLDPELAKNILVRDFDNFRDRGIFHNEKDDPLSGHLFALEGTKWKSLRAKLTPTFTSGKMKMMFETILNVANEMKSYLKEIADKGDAIEIRDVMARFTTDVIGNCAFGIDCNSIKDPNAEFRRYGKRVFEPSNLDLIKNLFTISFPNLAKKLHIRLINTDVSNFFLNIVEETIKFRKENKIQRNDFMDLLIKMEDDSDLASSDKLTIKEIAAQSFLFFLAGFETSSATLTFGLYELGKNIDIQNKVREEINSVLEKYNGEITYDAILEMNYLDKVINETLRKYPPLDNLIRKAVNDYKVTDTNHTIEKDTMLLVPIYGFHHNPNNYPDPETFDPERFSPENIGRRHQFSYLPFGDGPRNCIGMRFGQMQTRLGLISILKNFRVLLNEKTAKTVEFIPKSPFISMKGGVWLTFENV